MADRKSASPGLVAGVEALLGRPADGHPAGSEVLALVEGTLAPERARAVRAHLASCEACAGLEGAAREGLEQALVDERPDAAPAPLLMPLRLSRAEQPRAMAASETGEAAPLPEDRQELARPGAGLRAVYFRRQGRGKVGLFGDGAPGGEVLLGGAALEPEERGPDFLVFDLGPVHALEGQELEVRLGGGVRRFALEGA
jgi:hypothetical protein